MNGCPGYPFKELDELVLCYATTIHKSQGSEYPVVVIPISKGNDALMQAIRERDQTIHPDDVSMVIVEAVWERLREMVPKVH